MSFCSRDTFFDFSARRTFREKLNRNGKSAGLSISSRSNLVRFRISQPCAFQQFLKKLYQLFGKSFFHDQYFVKMTVLRSYGVKFQPWRKNRIFKVLKFSKEFYAFCRKASKFYVKMTLLT